jgi:BirA family transcriptional regulator, biotin operon repressor / biotin---[acetyl-CoA-carboxylase] ligase
MAELPADLQPAALRAHLHTARLGQAYEPLAICESTNDRCARRAREGAPEGLLVVADGQSGGRGRMGRTWFSPAGQNLYLSLLLRPPVPAHRLPPLTLVAGAAIGEVLVRALSGSGARPRLKWPNDVEVDAGDDQPRKLAGILTEMATEREQIRHVVLGIGINVNQAVFPGELAGKATSLALLSGRTHDRTSLLADLLHALEPACDQALRDAGADGLARWRSLAGLPRPCRISRPEGDAPLVGTAMDIDAEGALLFRNAQGQMQRVLSGELIPL